MNPEIVELEEFKVVGMQSFGKGNRGQLLEMWDVLQGNALKTPNRINRKYSYGIESFTKEFDEDKKWFYLAGVQVKDLSKVPVQMCAKVIPKNKYAVFIHKGPVKGFGKLYEKIYTEWLPESGYQAAGPYDFERYDKRFISPQHDDSITEIFIPIKKARRS